jgi:VPDSG-CTERM motif
MMNAIQIILAVLIIGTGSLSQLIDTPEFVSADSFSLQVKKDKKDKKDKPYNVPDAGSTAALLGVALAAIAGLRYKIS